MVKPDCVVRRAGDTGLEASCRLEPIRNLYQFKTGSGRTFRCAGKWLALVWLGAYEEGLKDGAERAVTMMRRRRERR